MSKFVVILTTTATTAEAETIAKALVDEKLAACVVFQPGTQSYCVWDGKAQLSTEVTVLIKTNDDKINAIENRFRTLHPYQVPVFVVLPSTYVGKDYSSWVNQQLAG